MTSVAAAKKATGAVTSPNAAIAIAPDSNLWIVGWMQSDDKPHTPLLARFLKNGTLDKTFNPPHGYQSLDMPGENDLVMHASTLHVGNHHVLVSANSQALWGPNHARVYRLGLAGEPGFGLRKWIEITHGTDEVFVASVIQQNRAFLVAGTLVASTLKAGQKQSRGFIARFHDDGTPDLSFGEQDAFRVYASPFIDHNIAFNHLLQRPDGRLTAVGTLPNERPRDTHAMVWQFKGDGTIDASFNNGNPAVVTFNKYSNDEWLTATLHADGKLVVAGHASRWGLHLARYRTDGSLDNAFGENGVVHLDRMSARSMTLRPLSPTATLLAYNGLGPGGHLGLLAKFRN